MSAQRTVSHYIKHRGVLTTIIICLSGSSWAGAIVTIVVVGIVTADRGRPAHIFIDRAPRPPRVIAALIGVGITRGIIALDFLDRVVQPTVGVDVSVAARIPPRVVVIVVRSIPGGWAGAVTGVIATILVIRHRGGDG